jgi:hypothetical protein
VLEGSAPRAFAKTFHTQGRAPVASLVGTSKLMGTSKSAQAQTSKGSYRCFVVDGKAECIQAPSNSAARRKIAKLAKEKVPTTLVTAQRLAEIKADIAGNKEAADKLLANEGWTGVEKSQQHMADLIAHKIRRLSRMVSTLRQSNDGIVQALIAKASAPGPPVKAYALDPTLRSLERGGGRSTKQQRNQHGQTAAVTARKQRNRACFWP